MEWYVVLALKLTFKTMFSAVTCKSSSITSISGLALAARTNAATKTAAIACIL